MAVAKAPRRENRPIRKTNRPTTRRRRVDSCKDCAGRQKGARIRERRAGTKPRSRCLDRSYQRENWYLGRRRWHRGTLCEPENHSASAIVDDLAGQERLSRNRESL